MTDIKSQLIEGMRGQGIRLPDGDWLRLDDNNLELLAERLLRTPGIAIADTDELRKAIAGGIQSYAGGESCAYSYHGDGSALDAMRRLGREADGIARYVFTSSVLAAAVQAQEEQ